MYLVFGGHCYYANGGANDLIGQFMKKDAAIECAISCIGMEAIIEKDEDQHELKRNLVHYDIRLGVTYLLSEQKERSAGYVVILKDIISSPEASSRRKEAAQAALEKIKKS